MAGLNGAVQVLTVTLLVVVAGLLLYGLVVFRGPIPAASTHGDSTTRRVNMRLEVLWTAVATAILVGIFVYVR